MATAAEKRRYKALAESYVNERIERIRDDVAQERALVEFTVNSASQPGKTYAMVMTPEGYAVHQLEGCEGEVFNGPLACWHSRSNSKVTALTPYQAQAVARRQEFSAEDVQVIKNTICRGSSDAELGMFLATCRSTGLNPFMHQIWAIQRNVNVGSSQAPKYEKQMQIQVGIDGYRVVRDRLVDRDGNPYFDGMEGPQWSSDGINWQDVWVKDTPPVVARVAIYRKGISRPFMGQARWGAYNQNNAMWKTMGAEQLAKCAEALALRRAFPADMSALPQGSIADLEAPTLTELAEMPAPVAALIQSKEPEAEYREIINHETGEVTEVPVGVSDGPGVGTMGTTAVSTPPTPACKHDGEPFFDDAGVMRCGICKLPMEGPNSVATGPLL